jgi:hypothetical protein
VHAQAIAGRVPHHAARAGWLPTQPWRMYSTAAASPAANMLLACTPQQQLACAALVLGGVAVVLQHRHHDGDDQEGGHHRGRDGLALLRLLLGPEVALAVRLGPRGGGCSSAAIGNGTRTSANWHASALGLGQWQARCGLCTRFNACGVSCRAVLMPRAAGSIGRQGNTGSLGHPWRGPLNPLPTL